VENSCCLNKTTIIAEMLATEANVGDAIAVRKQSSEANSAMQDYS
jgi:hypothetical protein